MTKKSYRAQQGSTPRLPGPRYPTLHELRSGALRGWGLAAMGTVLLGGAGYWRPASAAEQGSHLTRKKTKGRPDSGVPPKPPRPGGAPPPIRMPEIAVPKPPKGSSGKQGKVDEGKQGRVQKDGAKESGGSKAGEK